MNKYVLVLTAMSAYALCYRQFFYFPFKQQTFASGDVVRLHVNKMTSSTKLMPVDFYDLPFCASEGGQRMHDTNLGEILAGDYIQSSPYLLKMKEEMYCQQLCVSDLGPEGKRYRPNQVIEAIRTEYDNNWIVDNLPAVSRVNGDYGRERQGFPIGFVAKDGKAYVHNHVNIDITYQKVRDQNDKYRIIKFAVEPFSIKHDFLSLNGKNENSTATYDNVSRVENVATINNPIASCNPNTRQSERKHTTHRMFDDTSRLPQPANGKVLFTYDVQWSAGYFLWASRWDMYLGMHNAIPARVHWQSTANSLIIVCLLSTITIAILLRDLRKDLARFKLLPTDEEKADDFEEKSWKLVHADVFRPPSFSPLTLSVCCGIGAQLLCVTFLMLIFLALGFPSPTAARDVFGMVVVFFFITGPVSGYVTARLYRTFKCKAWLKATVFTVLGFPGLCLTLFFLIDLLLGLDPMASLCQSTCHERAAMVYFFIIGPGSGYVTARLYRTFKCKAWLKATVFTVLGFPGLCVTLFVLIDLLVGLDPVASHCQSTCYKRTAMEYLFLMSWWLGPFLPLVFLGAYFGYKQDAIEYPVRTSSIPRQIPVQPWFMGIFFTLMIAGIVPFCTCFLELYIIMSSVWTNHHGYAFGFLLLLFFVLIITCAEITLLVNYFQLCHFDYHWWWRSFGTAGSMAIYVFLYSLFYFKQVQGKSFVPYVFYYACMGLASFGLFLMTGFVGVASSLWFNLTIFGPLKVN